MSAMVDYFYYDYLLYQNIKRFIGGERPNFDIIRILSSNLKGLEDQLALKLKLNRIISILQTHECKTMVVCCRFDLLNKLSRCILVQCANSELHNVLLQTYLVIGKKKDAFITDKVYNLHVRSFKKKIRQTQKSIERTYGEKIKTKILFRIGSEEFEVLFTALMREEVKRVFKTLKVPFLYTISDDKIKEIKTRNTNYFDRKSRGKRIGWSNDNSVL